MIVFEASLLLGRKCPYTQEIQQDRQDLSPLDSYNYAMDINKALLGTLGSQLKDASTQSADVHSSHCRARAVQQPLQSS